MGKRENFTAVRVAEFGCSAGKHQAIYWDGKQPGLGLRVTAKGARAYVFQGWIDGGSVRITIGSPDVWPLETIWTTDPSTGQRVEVQRGARQEAARLKALVDSGVNPAEQRREQTAEKVRRKTVAESLKSKTVEALFTAYIDLLKQREKLARATPS